MPSQAVLSSWKEIAQYVGRGVRTVQRWEKNFGFPVRRPKGAAHGAVLAIPQEIDAWLRRPRAEVPKNMVRGRVQESCGALHLRTEALLRTAGEVKARTQHLNESLGKIFSEYGNRRKASKA